MDYTPNIDAQGMRRPMGPVDQPNWNGGPRLNHNPQVMNNRAVGQPNLSNAMANQQPIIPIRGRIVTSEQDIVPAEIPMDGSICLFMTEDCKSIIAKQWNSNGVLQSLIYSPSSNEQAQSEDKERMEERGKEHVEKAIISMRDIWSEASPELKRAMKTELSTLVDNMTI